MISRDCIITVNGNTATIDSDIYLYKYDKNIQLAFSIINSKYMYDNDDSNNLVKSMQAAYAQVKFKKNDSTDIAIEFDIQATKKGAVLLTINEELTDEDTELGEYTIQIRLLDANKNSVVTLPPVESCIHILAPLFEKLGADTNEVNKAIVNKAVARYAAPLSATTEDGTFNSKTWVDGDKITTAELNRMETGIKTNSTQYKDIAHLFTTEQTTNSYKIKCGNKVIAEIPIGNTTPVEPVVKKYTITSTLHNATSNNNKTEIEENQPYTATITANKGYEISTATVTMGGTDITSTVYSGGNINIPKVTGNLIITVECTEIVQPTNYTITNNLTNYTTNNYNKSIAANAKYVAKLEPTMEYKPNTLSISMGGKDITNEVYDKYNRIVTINQVTGNIIINANGVSIQNETIIDGNVLTLKRSHNVNTEGFGNMATTSCSTVEYIEVNSEEIIISAGYKGFILSIICYDENKKELGAIDGDRYRTLALPWNEKKRSICLKKGTKFIKLGFQKTDNYAWFYHIQPLYKNAINGFIIVNNKKYTFTPYCNNSITGIGNYQVDGNYTADNKGIEIKSYDIAVNSTVLLHPVTKPFEDKSFYDIEFICDANNATIDEVGNVTRLSDKEFTVTIKATNAGNSYTTDVTFNAITVKNVNSINALNMGVGETYSIPYSTSPVINYSDSVSLEKPNTDDIIKINKDNSITALKDGISSVNIVAKNLTKTIPVEVGKEISNADGEYL